MPTANKLITAAFLGKDAHTIYVNTIPYKIKPLTIKKIVGMGFFLDGISDCENGLKEAFSALGKADRMAEALSWAIQGNSDLKEELMEGTIEELVVGLSAAYSTISPKSFTTLSALTRNVATLIAKAKPR